MALLFRVNWHFLIWVFCPVGLICEVTFGFIHPLLQKSSHILVSVFDFGNFSGINVQILDEIWREHLYKTFLQTQCFLFCIFVKSEVFYFTVAVQNESKNGQNRLFWDYSCVVGRWIINCIVVGCVVSCVVVWRCVTVLNNSVENIRGVKSDFSYKSTILVIQLLRPLLKNSDEMSLFPLALFDCGKESVVDFDSWC